MEFEDFHILIILSHIQLLKLRGQTCYLNTVLTVSIPVIIILHIIHKNKQNDFIPNNANGHISLLKAASLNIFANFLRCATE